MNKEENKEEKKLQDALKEMREASTRFITEEKKLQDALETKKKIEEIYNDRIQRKHQNNYMLRYILKQYDLLMGDSLNTYDLYVTMPDQYTIRAKFGILLGVNSDVWEDEEPSDAELSSGMTSILNDDAYVMSCADAMNKIVAEVEKTGTYYVNHTIDYYSDYNDEHQSKIIFMISILRRTGEETSE